MKLNLILICVQQYRNKNDEEKRIGESDGDSKIVLIQGRVTSTVGPKSEAYTTDSNTKFNPSFPNKNLVLKKSKSIAVDDSIHIRYVSQSLLRRLGTGILGCSTIQKITERV